jgi:hypothetical protein
VPCLELIREDGAVILRVNLIQKPVVISAPRRVVFGLMATPAKPMPANWRRITFGRFDAPNLIPIQWMGSEYWGANQHCSSKYPRNRDLSFLDALRDCRQGRPVDHNAVIGGFEERNFQPGIPDGEKSKQEILYLLGVSLGMASGAPAGAYFNVYWEEFHSTEPTHEEVETFQNEWSGAYGYGSVGGLAPSHRDFAVYYGAEFIKRGIGLYFDNAFPKRAYDPLTSSAYRRPDGTLQPSAGMWAHREYLRRIWMLHRELGPRDIMPLMMIHITNTHIVPYMVWNEANLDLEWFYGPEPAQQKYPPELLRAESLGLQSGNLPLALARVENTKTDEEKRIAERTRVAALMVHEIKVGVAQMEPYYRFGYGQDDCAVFNYWAADYPVETSHDAQVKSLLLVRGGEALLLVCTWNPQPERVTLTLDSAQLGLALTRAYDEETGAALDFVGGRLPLPLEGYGVRLVHFR